jgi:hypothetical protein
LTAVLQNKKQWQLLTVKTKQKIAGSIVESLTPQGFTMRIHVMFIRRSLLTSVALA